MVIPSVLQPDALRAKDFPKSAGQDNHNGKQVDINDHRSPPQPLEQNSRSEDSRSRDNDRYQQDREANSSNSNNNAESTHSETERTGSGKLYEHLERPTHLTERREPSDASMELETASQQQDGIDTLRRFARTESSGGVPTTNNSTPLAPLVSSAGPSTSVPGGTSSTSTGGRSLREDMMLMNETNKVAGMHPEEQEVWVREHYRTRRNTDVRDSSAQEPRQQEQASDKEQREDEETPQGGRAVDRPEGEAEIEKRPDGERRSSGEWVRPLQAFPMQRQSSSIEESVKPTEGKIVLPAFYRKPTVDQSALSHRLAVLSVNNFSGEHGVGEDDIGMDPVEEDRKRARKALGEGADADDIEERATEIKKERIDAKEEEISHSLKHDDKETLQKKIVPSALLRTAKEGDQPGESQVRPSQVRQDTDRTLRQIADANRRDFAMEEAQENGDDAASVRSFNDEEAEAYVAAETERRSKISRQEKLDALCEEFGTIADLIEGDEPEEFIVECKGGLFRGILILGNIHLTTHRLTFHAVLPPPKMLLPGDESSKLLHTGAATIHRHNPIFANKTSRVWMELDAEMITTYPSADEEGRVKPLRSILRELLPNTDFPPSSVYSPHLVPLLCSRICRSALSPRPGQAFRHQAALPIAQGRKVPRVYRRHPRICFALAQRLRVCLVSTWSCQAVPA